MKKEEYDSFYRGGCYGCDEPMKATLPIPLRLISTLSEVLFNQALLIEGLPIEDPVAYSNAIWSLLEK